MDELEKTNEILDKIAKRNSEILDTLDKIRRREIRRIYFEIADKMCRTKCEERHGRRDCENCPLVEGYKQLEKGL